ncbi:MAG: twin-arginine translocation signal domain-containing protein, partial [Planctomycetes bacterium]|nr:twin-arginine translocation signal domain-containing protein [Planctomycetota bacterium]
MSTTTRRQFLANTAAGAVLLSPTLTLANDAKPVETFTITEGDLKVMLRDNSQSPKVLSGVDSLFNRKDAPDFDAFDPDIRGASAGLNFEHIISGHKNKNNSFTPRKGKFTLSVLPDRKSAMLVRKREDDPWSMSSKLKYTVTKPHYIDVEFRCRPHNPAIFGDRGYAILFFANYMNDVQQVALNFQGIKGENQKEQWISADAPKGHPDWNQGGTYRSSTASDLEYDADHNFKLNSWSYDFPRFTKPFYYGRAAKDMVFMLMFNKIYTDEDEIRFSLFKFKLRRFPRPA